MPNFAGLRLSFITDLIVLAAMLSVAAAVAVALIIEADIAPAIAASVAATGYFAAVIGHILLRKTQKLERLQAELGALKVTTGAVADEEARVTDVSSCATSSLQIPPSPLSVPTIQKEVHLTSNAYNAEDDKTSDPSAPADSSLARLRVTPPKRPTQATVPLPASKKADINKIIRRLEGDITSGRKIQEGVSIARPQNPLQTLHLAPAQHEKPVKPDDDVKDLQLGQKAHQTVSSPQQASTKADATDKLAAVADALAREQLDVFLEPIHGLDDGKECHFEVSIRLHLADGDVIDDKGCHAIARGAAWLPLIDAVKVSEAKKVALYLLQSGKSGACISQIDGASVSAGKSFSDDLASLMGQDKLTASRLVLSITQDDVRRFTSAQWATVNRLRQLGFRFALAEVNSLDLDFEMLAEQGFEFAKLDSLIFLKGLPTAQTLIPAADVCRYLAAAGLKLIVDGLADEAQKLKALGFGALYGQGMLFGAPRPVRAEYFNAPSAEQAQLHQTLPI